MTINFSNSEKALMLLFEANKSFFFMGKNYEAEIIGKPTSVAGEPKTDLFIRARSNEDNNIIELKISYKQKNADFLENKISSDRAHQLFGNDWKSVIIDSTTKIKHEFESRQLIFNENQGKTKAGSITLGWKFEILNRKSGKLSGKLVLDKNQMIDVISGKNSNSSKKNAYVNGVVITDSGISNYLLEREISESTDLNQVLESLITIDEYVESSNEMFFACKALNYRQRQNKWDGDRPLAVYVDWSFEQGKLVSEIKYDKPLEEKGNERAKKIISLLKAHNINI
jgi:hypothetical protein